MAEFGGGDESEESPGQEHAGADVVERAVGDADRYDVEQNGVTQQEEENHPCICGYNGLLANHLRVFFQCVQVLKKQVGIGDEMSHEEFCIRAALLVRQCPAFGCAGGDHSEIPDICVKWWKSAGWEIMDWEGNAENITSLLIKKRSNRFVKELENYQAPHQQSQMNQTGRRDVNLKLDGIQGGGYSEERMLDNPNAMVPPSLVPQQTTVQQHVQAASTNQNLVCGNAAEVEFQQTMEKAKAISRSETPGCLNVKDLIPLGIRHAASLGILCRWPSLPINGNSIIPMNGNCIFTCFVHANNPTLRGEILVQAVWELRVRAVGTFIDRLKLFNDEQWSLLQAIVTGDREVTPSRDEIRQEIETYMESGEYSGDFGDVILNIAASFLQQPVLVIQVKEGKVTNAHWVDPTEIFGGENKSLGFPVVVLKQLNHCEVLLIAGEAKDTARMSYQQWKASERVGVSPGRDDLNPGVVHDVVGSHMGNLTERTMLEPDGIFSPPFTSTPRLQQHQGNPQQQHMVSHDFINQVRVFVSISLHNICSRREEMDWNKVAI